MKENTKLKYFRAGEQDILMYIPQGMWKNLQLGSHGPAHMAGLIFCNLA